MSRRKSMVLSGCLLLSAAAHTQEDGAIFTVDGELTRPNDFREWVYLSSGLGMTYGPLRPDPGENPMFSNVFVNPSAYESFMQTGEWPSGTIFVIDIRGSVRNASINNGGWTQSDSHGIEVAVKDTARFPDAGWAYFSFGSDPDESELPHARTESCYNCHSTHGAVEWTFTQFYPDQFAVAQRLGTVRDDYDPERKVQ